MKDIIVKILLGVLWVVCFPIIVFVLGVFMWASCFIDYIHEQEIEK